jgi:hypothetical protein
VERAAATLLLNFRRLSESAMADPELQWLSKLTQIPA